MTVSVHYAASDYRGRERGAEGRETVPRRPRVRQPLAELNNSACVNPVDLVVWRIQGADPLQRCEAKYRRAECGMWNVLATKDSSRDYGRYE
jgi:hypothetical protein